MCHLISLELFRLQQNLIQELILRFHNLFIIANQLFNPINTPLLPIINSTVSMITNFNGLFELLNILSKLFQFSTAPVFRQIQCFRSEIVKLEIAVILSIISFLISESFSFKFKHCV